MCHGIISNYRTDATDAATVPMILQRTTTNTSIGKCISSTQLFTKSRLSEAIESLPMKIEVLITIGPKLFSGL